MPIGPILGNGLLQVREKKSTRAVYKQIGGCWKHTVELVEELSVKNFSL